VPACQKVNSKPRLLIALQTDTQTDKRMRQNILAQPHAPVVTMHTYLNSLTQYSVLL